MKFLWQILIHLALLLVVASAVICFILFYKADEKVNETEISGAIGNELFTPTLEGYKNHQLVQFSPSTESDINKLIDLQTKLSLIPWSSRLQLKWPIQFQIPPEQTKLFTLATEALHLPFILLSPNLEEYLLNRKRVITKFNLKKSSDFNLNRYHYYTEIEKYLNKLSEEYTNRLIVNSYGSSIENRQL